MCIYTFQGHNSAQCVPHHQLLGVNDILLREKSVISLMWADLLSQMITNLAEGDQRVC